VDKIYLETHRDVVLVDEQTILAAKNLKDKGIETAGGITYTIAERPLQTFCYTRPESNGRGPGK